MRPRLLAQLLSLSMEDKTEYLYVVRWCTLLTSFFYQQLPIRSNLWLRLYILDKSYDFLFATFIQLRNHVAKIKNNGVWVHPLRILKNKNEGMVIRPLFYLIVSLLRAPSHPISFLAGEESTFFSFCPRRAIIIGFVISDPKPVLQTAVPVVCVTSN